MYIYLHSFSDSPCVSVVDGCGKCAVWPEYAMMIGLCMIDYCLFFSFASPVMCLMFFQSRGESPAGFINVNFTAFTRDVVNTWMVVRSSPVLICVKNRFKLVYQAMAYDYVGSFENALNVVWYTTNEGENNTCFSFRCWITSFLWFRDFLVGGIIVEFNGSRHIV